MIYNQIVTWTAFAILVMFMTHVMHNISCRLFHPTEIHQVYKIRNGKRTPKTLLRPTQFAKSVAISQFFYKNVCSKIFHIKIQNIHQNKYSFCFFKIPEYSFKANIHFFQIQSIHSKKLFFFFKSRIFIKKIHFLKRGRIGQGYPQRVTEGVGEVLRTK